MKKVLFVITKSNWGGAQRYVFDLATALPKEQCTVVVALGGTGAPGSAPGTLQEKLEAANIPTVFVESFMRDLSLFKELRALRELRAIFKTEKPDIVHLNSSKAGGVGALAARMAGVPKIIFTSHGLAWDENRNFLARLFIYFLSRLTFALCHQIIVISEDNLRRARTRKATLVHNGIAPIAFLERDAARAELSKSMKPLPQSTFWIGSGTELTANKGLTYLLKAAARLKKEGRQFELAIVGEGEERAHLEALIQKEDLMGSVHLLGFVPDAAQYFKAFDIFVLPSVKEGLPYSLLEAGQAGVATVASDVGGIPDIVAPEALVAAKDVRGLAEKLRILMDNAEARAQLGTALQTKVQTDFSLQKMVSETAVLYLS